MAVRGFCAVAVAVIVLLAGCTSGSRPHASTLASHAGSSGSSLAAPPTHERWRTVTLQSGVSISAPVSWYSTPYRGVPATVYFPLLFLGSQPFTGPCTDGGSTPSACTGQHWFPDSWRTPPDGLLVLWSQRQYPTAAGAALRNLPGHRTTIDHRPAKVWSGTATSRCPAGADTEMDAYISDNTPTRTGSRYDMTACFGPSSTTQDHTAVHRMLLSLGIKD